MTITIQLTKNALDKLFEGENDAIVSLRDGVVANFVRHTLFKGMPHDFNEYIKTQLDRIEQQIMEEARKAIPAEWSYNGWKLDKTHPMWKTYQDLIGAYMTEQFKTMVTNLYLEREKELRNAVERTVNVKSRATEARIEKLVQEKFDELVEKKIRDEVTSRLRALLATVEK